MGGNPASQGRLAVSLDRVAAGFLRFAALECCGVSALYEGLSLKVAEDEELLQLAAHARAGQPRPNLFFAAVHYLLLRGAGSPLERYYLWVDDHGPLPPDEHSYPHFRAFCLDHWQEVWDLLSTPKVQTNEVRRCGCLLPGFVQVANEAGGAPLGLVEIGASAGLNLLWDRYGYDFGNGLRCGDGKSPVQISCALRGDNHPDLSDVMPPVASRLGLDLEPIDLDDTEAVLWLRALVWPDEGDRGLVLQRAVELAAALAGVPQGALPCVFHTFTVNQFSPEMMDRLEYILAEHGKERTLVRLSIECHRGLANPQLALTSYEGGDSSTRMLANCDVHGQWLEPEPEPVGM